MKIVVRAVNIVIIIIIIGIITVLILKFHRLRIDHDRPWKGVVKPWIDTPRVAPPVPTSLLRPRSIRAGCRASLVPRVTRVYLRHCCLLCLDVLPRMRGMAWQGYPSPPPWPPRQLPLPWPSVVDTLLGILLAAPWTVIHIAPLTRRIIIIIIIIGRLIDFFLRRPLEGRPPPGWKRDSATRWSNSYRK